MVARGWKIAVIKSNIFILCIGAVLVGIATWTIVLDQQTADFNRFDGKEMYNMEKSGLLDVAAFMSITAGVGLILLSGLALAGVITESSCCMALYVALMSVILLILATVIILCGLFMNRLDGDLEKSLYHALKNQYEGDLGSDQRFSHALDYVQVQFECCGIRNYTDFEQADHWWDRDSLTVPKPCCIIDKHAYTENYQFVFQDISCARIPTLKNSRISKGCYDDIKDWLSEKTTIIMALAALTIFFQIITIPCAGCLLGRLRSKESKKGSVAYTYGYDC